MANFWKRSRIGAEYSVFVPTEQLARFEKYKDDLTVILQKEGDDEIVELWTAKRVKGGVRFYMPREYGTLKFGEAEMDQRTTGHPVDREFLLELRKNQPKVVERASRALLAGRSGIIQCPPGSGKTVMALYLMAKVLKTTTLVLCARDFIVNQWKERAKMFLGLTEDEIGYVWRDKCDYEGKKLVIGMIPSLMRREYPAEMYKHFGAVIIDECHSSVAPRWARAIKKFPAKWRIGLSATPRRGDGLHSALSWTIGSIITRSKKWEMVPKVYMVSYPVHIKDTAWNSGGGLRARGVLLSFIARLRARNNVVVKYIVEAVAKQRKVFVLSSRRKQLDTLKVLLLQHGIGSGFYTGGMKMEELDESAKQQVILATYEKAREALDIPDLDALIMATPVTDIEQSVGRIVRQLDGKKQPIVVDLVDTHETFENMARQRENQYRSFGCTISCVGGYGSAWGS